MTDISTKRDLLLLASILALAACGHEREPGEGSAAPQMPQRSTSIQFALDDSAVTTEVDENGRTFALREERGDESRPQGEMLLKDEKDAVVASIALLEGGFLDGQVASPMNGGRTAEQWHLLKSSPGIAWTHVKLESKVDVTGAFANGYRQGRWEWIVAQQEGMHPTESIARIVDEYDENGRALATETWLRDGTRIEHQVSFDNCDELGKFSEAMKRWTTLKPLVERGIVDINERLPLSIFQRGKQCGSAAEHYTYPLLIVPVPEMRPMIEAGADPDVVSSKGESPVLKCVERVYDGSCTEDLLLWLIERSESVDVLQYRHGTPLTKLLEFVRSRPETVLSALDALLAKGANPNRLVYDKSALYLAARSGSLAAAELLVEHPGTDLGLVGSLDGDFALAPILASAGYRDEKGYQLRKAALVDRFVARGGLLPDRGLNGIPLWATVKSKDREGYLAVIATLRKHGVDFDVRNDEGRNFEEEMLATGQAWALDG